MYRWRHTAAGEISVLQYFCVKIRNLLHILYRLPLEGCAVISDAVYSEDYVEYIIEYNGDREVLMDLYQPYGLNIIDDRYAVAYQPFPAGYMESFSRLEYNLFPKVYGLMDDVGALEAIGVINIQQENILGLTGKGILLGIVDTGIDIFGSSFVRDGGKTKILAAWDQTVEEADNASYGYGREYSTEEIQAAVDERQRILTDTTGHGSFCAGTAVSVAPSADLVVVKLKQAKQNLRSFYGIPSDANAYSEVDIMTAIAYLLEQQKKLRMPMSILVTLGTNSGSHTGAEALDKYINNIGELQGLAVSAAGGNEGRAGHHYSGIVTGAYDVVEIDVADRNSFTLEIWGKSTNTYSVAIEIPGGEFIERISPRYDRSSIIRPIFGGGMIYVDYFLIEDSAGQELIMLRFITPANGIWRIRVYGVGTTELSFNAWLPISSFVSPGTRFVSSDPGVTITSPAVAETAICTCAYDHSNGNLYIDNSRGYTADGRVKPDLLAPGVNIRGEGASGETVIRSGTSVAASYTAGCSAIMLEWSYGRKMIRNINGNQIRGYLIRGAVRPGSSGGLLEIRQYPNPEWGYGLLNIYNTFESLRNV